MCIRDSTITAAALLAFPVQANGSLVQRDGVIVGSALIGQANDDARYFWPRPSAVAYMDGSTPGSLGSSGASNLAPTSTTLADQVAVRDADFRAANDLTATAPIPPDMLTASGSGLDPHISPAAARAQVSSASRCSARATRPPSQAVCVITKPPSPPRLSSACGAVGRPHARP